MADAPRERPAVAKELRSFSAFISTDDDDVFDALVRRIVPTPDVAPFVLVDRESRLVVVQGGWWYRGEWRVSRDPAGSLVDYTIVNVARRARWASALTARRPLAAAPAAFDEVAEALRAELE
jgi:hypothetical protein